MQEASAAIPWYRTLSATQWKTLAASNLGWMFDGYETFALILTVGVALRQLLKEHPDPADDEIRHYLSGNLCRCATYPEIVKAVKLAATKMRQTRA